MWLLLQQRKVTEELGVVPGISKLEKELRVKGVGPLLKGGPEGSSGKARTCRQRSVEAVSTGPGWTTGLSLTLPGPPFP